MELAWANEERRAERGKKSRKREEGRTGRLNSELGKAGTNRTGEEERREEEEWQRRWNFRIMIIWREVSTGSMFPYPDIIRFVCDGRRVRTYDSCLLYLDSEQVSRVRRSKSKLYDFHRDDVFLLVIPRLEPVPPFHVS